MGSCWELEKGKGRKRERERKGKSRCCSQRLVVLCCVCVCVCVWLQAVVGRAGKKRQAGRAERGRSLSLCQRWVMISNDDCCLCNMHTSIITYIHTTYISTYIHIYLHTHPHWLIRSTSQSPLFLFLFPFLFLFLCPLTLPKQPLQLGPCLFKVVICPVWLVSITSASVITKTSQTLKPCFLCRFPPLPLLDLPTKFCNFVILWLIPCRVCYTRETTSFPIS